MAELTLAAIDQAALQARAIRADCGAVIVFLGTTRDHHDGRRVLQLAYEAYESMALEALARLEREACERFEVSHCEVTHRLGEVPPTEASVVVVVSAAHRGAAYEASRWVMDELKARVPIWKRERFEDGNSQWVDGTPLR
ncbi:MAG: molybdenum cofactor biosynthesis protein MoaE [Candidatus Eisenbacteria bacterium]